MSPRRRRVLLGLGIVVAVVSIAAVALVRPDLDAAELKAKYADFPSAFVPALGLQVHARDTGKGPAVVLVHGLFDSLRTWDAVAADLEKDHRVLRFDLPGHGLTGPDPTGDYSIARQVAFVDAVTQAAGVESFALVGNSLGGEISWNYAASGTTRVTKLVLVDAAGHPRKDPPSIVKLARTPVLGALLECCILRSFLEKTVASSRAPGAAVDPATVDRYFELARFPGNRPAIRARLLQRNMAPDLAPLAKITAPTLVLWGEADGWIPLADADAFGREIAGAKVVKFPGVGHVPQEEAPALVIRELRAFLDAP